MSIYKYIVYMYTYIYKYMWHIVYPHVYVCLNACDV